MKLHTLVEKFIQSYKGVYAPTTVNWYENRLKPLVLNLGDKDITKISIDDLRSLFTTLSEKKCTYINHPGHPLVEKGYSKYSLHAFARSWKRLFRGS